MVEAGWDTQSGKSSKSGSVSVGVKQPTGSYTNTHASGKTYSGKGSKERSQTSGKREEKRNNDTHIATEWTPAPTNREAFKSESVKIDQNGGVKNTDNYNRIESPGKKYRIQDGELNE